MANYMTSTVTRSTYNFFYVLDGDPISQVAPIIYYSAAGYNGCTPPGGTTTIDISQSKTGWEPTRDSETKVSLVAC